MVIERTNYCILPLILLSAVFISHSASQTSNDDLPRFTSNGQPPRFFPVNLEVDGPNLVLPCEVTGIPTPTVSWFRFRNDTPIDSASVRTDGTLSIRVTEAEASREGTNYYCTATNTIRSTVGPESTITAVVRSRNVSVSSKFFESRGAEVATIEGASVALECAFNPNILTPNITWFANDVIIMSETGVIQFLDEGRYLYILRLSADDRLKRYHCEVNQNGMAIRAPTTYTLSTLIPEGITVYNNASTFFGVVDQPVELVFVAAAHDSGVALSVVINCPRTDPLVTFAPSIGTTVRATLTEAARNESQVEFTCEIATTRVPRLRKDVMVIIILLPRPVPMITNPAPDDLSLNDRNHIVGDGPVMYSCEASGSPPPTITWYYNGELQPSSDGVTVDKNSLTISAPEVRHSGIYQCFATNQIGDDNRAWILGVSGLVIRIVDCESNFPIVEHNQNNFLLLPLGTTNLVITVTVETTFVGVPSRDDFCPNVQWQINGTDIANDTDYTVSNPCGDIRKNEGIHLFTLTIATFTVDTIGEYSLLSPEAGMSKELIVTFQECSKSGPDEPVSVGSRVDIRCWCRDIIPANVSWSKDGKSLDNSDQITTSQAINNVFVLSIEPVRVIDRGRYTCTITTGAGQYSGNINVEVMGLENNGGPTILGGALRVTGVTLVFIGVEIIVMVIFIDI